MASTNTNITAVYLPIITLKYGKQFLALQKIPSNVFFCKHYLAGTAFHSSQNVMKDDVTRIIPGMKTVVK